MIAGRSSWRCRFSVAISATALAALGLAGCGSGSDPASVVKTYFSAIAAGDGKTACAQLAPSAANQLAQVAQQAHLGSTCADVISKEAGQISAAAKQSLQNVKVTKTSTSGNAATVTATAPAPSNRTVSIHLSNAGGRWYINQTNLG